MVDGHTAQQTEYSSSTAPAQSTGLRGLAARARRTASACMLPLMQRAARPYVGGVTLDDAMTVVDRLAAEGFPSTLGFWDSDEETISEVTAEYRAAIARIATGGYDSYVSFKPPALRFDAALAAELAQAASAGGVRLHADSHGVEVADPSCAMLDTMGAHQTAARLSPTLPGRWSRSLSDADWVVERGYKARVVKGQWPDPAEPNRDLRAGFLEVIDRLAGRAEHVAVASHDVPLATEAIARLRRAGTSHELELLFSLPMKHSLAWAKEQNVPVRIYVPYGKGYLPYAIVQLRRNPRIAWFMLKDLVTFGRQAPGR